MALPEITIRDWTRKDRATIAHWPTIDLPAHWVSVTTATPRRSWAICLQSILVGRVTLREMSLDERSAQLGIYLHPDYLGQGIGTQALLAFMDVAPVRYVYLDVSPDNTRAMRCYEKAGFEAFPGGGAYIRMGRLTRASYGAAHHDAVREPVYLGVL
jgi:RimJ/RimL family protein N-acetyltransferase